MFTTHASQGIDAHGNRVYSEHPHLTFMFSANSHTNHLSAISDVKACIRENGEEWEEGLRAKVDVCLTQAQRINELGELMCVVLFLDFSFASLFFSFHSHSHLQLRCACNRARAGRLP